MSKTIWKFPLTVADVQHVAMPTGAEILCVQTQHEGPCLWVRVDPSATMEKRSIAIVGTGHPAPEPSDGDYIGTFQIHGGALVFHVFAKRRSDG